MTREQLVEAVYDSPNDCTCPHDDVYSCRMSHCRECADRLVTEFEQSIVQREKTNE